MKMMTAEVVNGRISVPDDSVRDGEIVTLLVHDADEPFELSEEQEKKLLAAIEQADRGETMDGWKLLDEIRS